MDQLNAVTFDDMLRGQDPFSQKDPVIDLRDVRLITPAGLVQLAALCFVLSEDGRTPALAISDASVRSYMARSGFFSVADGIVNIEPPIHAVNVYGYELMRGSNPMLIEVTKIGASAELPDLLDRVIDVLHRFKYRKYDRFDIATAASEILQNTFDHNSSACGFVAMQVYSRGGNRFLELAVADYGIGLAASLSKNPNNKAIASDLDAISMAIEPGTSEFEDPTRGTGLYHLLEIAYKHEGVVQIRSGEGKVRYRMDQRKGWGFRVPRMPGVQVSLNLPSKATTSS